MFRTPWLHNVLGLAQSRKDHRPAGRQRRSVRLTLEALEDRVVPSAVNSSQQLLVTPPASGGGNVASNTSATLNAMAAPKPDSVSVDATLSNVSFPYLPYAIGNRLTLTAIVKDTSNPNRVVNAGSVTFTVMDSSGKQIGNPVKVQQGSVVRNKNGGLIGVQVSVQSSQLPIMNAGTYTIKVSYTDSTGSFKDNGAGDKNGTITVGPRIVNVTLTPPVTVVFNEGQTLTFYAKPTDSTKAGKYGSIAVSGPIPVTGGSVEFNVTGPGGFSKTERVTTQLVV